jgi:hypothetical protein
MLVDEDARIELVAVPLTHPRHQSLETLGEHDVIVVAPGIASNRIRSVAGVILRPCHDDRLRRRQEVADIGARVG